MNYIGSKHSLLPFLHETIAQVTGLKPGDEAVFADLFSGTGAVGASFKEKGCRVLANDLQHYSYVLNKHKIGNTGPMPEEKVLSLNNLSPQEGFIYKNYCAGSDSGRNYFTDANGKKCDAIRTQIASLWETGSLSEGEYFYLLASLIDSVDRYANTASIYGAFLKHIKSSAARDLLVTPLPMVPGNPKGQVFHMDANHLIRSIQGDILYLDPPYNARQYSSNYHVLETISRYDKPQLAGATGLRVESGMKSAFCSKRQVGEALHDLLENARFKTIFLSYNNEGLLSLDEIRDLFQKFGTYERFTTPYRRFRSDKEESRNHKADSTLEYLHCLIR